MIKKLKLLLLIKTSKVIVKNNKEVIRNCFKEETFTRAQIKDRWNNGFKKISTEQLQEVNNTIYFTNFKEDCPILHTHTK